MELAYLREYLALAETLNYAVASRRLFVSQPTLSRHIQALEDEVGERLFERDRHGVELTRAGKVARDEFARVLGEYGNALRAIADAGEGSEEALVLGIPPLYIKCPWSHSLNRELSRLYPDAEVEPRFYGDRVGIDPLEEGEVDAAILVYPPGLAHEGERITRMDTVRLCVVASRAMELSTEKLADPMTFPNLRFVLPTADQDMRVAVADLLIRCGVDRKALLFVPGGDDALLRVMEGQDSRLCTIALDLEGMFDKVLTSVPIADAAFDARVGLAVRAGDQRASIARLVAAARAVRKKSL